MNSGCSAFTGWARQVSPAFGPRVPPRSRPEVIGHLLLGVVNHHGLDRLQAAHGRAFVDHRLERNSLARGLAVGGDSPQGPHR